MTENCLPARIESQVPDERLLFIGRKMLRRVKKFYKYSPSTEFAWTVLGQDKHDKFHFFSIPWNNEDRELLYDFAGELLQLASIQRYVICAEAWLHHPEGDREALVLGGADSNGNRWAQHHLIKRSATAVQLRSQPMMINEECVGDIFTLLTKPWKIFNSIAG